MPDGSVIDRPNSDRLLGRDPARLISRDAPRNKLSIIHTPSSNVSANGEQLGGYTSKLGEGLCVPAAVVDMPSVAKY